MVIKKPFKPPVDECSLKMIETNLIDLYGHTELERGPGYQLDYTGGLEVKSLRTAEFMSRNKISVRKPETTSIGRAVDFNKGEVQRFHRNLEE
ncbi:hypothetical protein J6590_080191 [Homalodisca vitripennis]|nr:hypothetical protein J6590_080191 [Homalodisca vitripennis]